MGAMASQITNITIFTQPFIQAQMKENIKAPRHWPLCGEFTGDRWIPRTNVLRVRLMTSSSLTKMPTKMAAHPIHQFIEILLCKESRKSKQINTTASSNRNFRKAYFFYGIHTHIFREYICFQIVSSSACLLSQSNILPYVTLNLWAMQTVSK